jgi:putative transposase
MRAGDVTDTLELALAASGCGTAKVVHRPRLHMIIESGQL